MSYSAADDRYLNTPFRTVGRSGLKLPPVSLGLWHNFGADTPIERQRAILPRRSISASRTSTSRTITHALRQRREQLRPAVTRGLPAVSRRAVISTKAGWDMWPGRTGGRGSRKYMLASLDQTCNAWGWSTSTSSTRIASIRHAAGRKAGALATAIQQARRCTSASPLTRPSRRSNGDGAARLELPLLIHQPKYSLLSARSRTGCSGRGARRRGHDRLFAAGAGRASSRYLDGIPTARAQRWLALPLPEHHAGSADKVRALNEIARAGTDTCTARDRWVARSAHDLGARRRDAASSSCAKMSQPCASRDQREELAAIDRIAGHRAVPD